MSLAPPPLRIGILGAANIARQFTAAVRTCPQVQVVAVASRSAQTAAAFAADCGIARHHGSYESLLADPGIDAIYLPLPNSLHAQWAIAAARAGKHVLSEKPLALGRQEVRAMFEAARHSGTMLLEAYPYWFQPQTRDLLGLLHGGAIGQVRGVQAAFGFMLRDGDTNIRMKPELGGGALLDAGSYAMSLIRLVMGQAPLRVQASSSMAPSGVDIATVATLDFGDGRSAQLSCAMNTAYHRRALVVGTAGVLETEYLNHTGPVGHPAGYLPSQMRLRRGIPGTVPFEEIHSATGSGFYFCAQAFAKVVAEQDFAAIERAAAASLDIATTLEAIARSAREGRAVDLPSD